MFYVRVEDCLERHDAYIRSTSASSAEEGIKYIFVGKGSFKCI